MCMRARATSIRRLPTDQQKSMFGRTAALALVDRSARLPHSGFTKI